MTTRNPKSKPPASGARIGSEATTVVIVGIVLATALLCFQVRLLWFTQDDAYISYRYAQNALAGHGLVFNIGERVEGYTNFLWVIWLMLAGNAGIPLDAAAKALGITSAVGMIVVTALLVRRVASKLQLRHGEWLAAAAAVWIGGNGALAYWAVSGLETAFFGFLVSLAVLLWWQGSRLTVVPITLAILTRPEGGLIWLCLVAGEWFASKNAKATMWYLVSVAIALIPFAVFKLVYYGDLLPNPFHAKTGLSIEYLSSGLSYLWQFLQEYGLWGVALIPLAVSLSIREIRIRVQVIMCIAFAAYVVAVGGDVLRPHRFFVPLLPVFVAVCAIGAAYLGSQIWRRRGTGIMTSLLIVLWGCVGFALAKSNLYATRELELGLTKKMGQTATQLRESNSAAFSVAVSTIGRLGYDLPGCRVIDMLGLTDREIARHPESVPGMTSSWKERNFNATYVLAQNPEFILFSTGYKPSAPAERALMLHSRFRRNYFGFLFYSEDTSLAVYRRKSIDTRTDDVWPDVTFADRINSAFNIVATQDYNLIAETFSRAHHSGPMDYGLAVAYIANALNLKGDLERAMAYADSAIAIDSFTVDAWQIKRDIHEKRGELEAAAKSRSDLSRILGRVR